MSEQPPPVIGQPPVLIAATNGRVIAIDPITGQEKWATPLQQGFFKATTHSDVCVLVSGEYVYAGASGHLFCLSIHDGSMLWHNPLEGCGYNDVSLAMEGVSVQWLKKVVKSSTNSSTT